MEINSDNQIATQIAFDPYNFEAAIAELDARYLAGEAAAHAHTWSVIAGTYAEFNRHDYDPSSVVNVDNRRVARFAPGDLTAANTKGITPNLRAYIESVHRLGDHGAVVTCQSSATSQEGFEAEWRTVLVQTVNGDLMDRNEMFDEADLDAALAKFEELSRRAPRLDNTASRVDQRFWQYFAVRDWKALAEIAADDILIDDRRRVVNAGVQHGRDALIADMQAIAEIEAVNITSTVIATRGERLALTRVRSSNQSLQPEEISAEVLSLIEIGADNRTVARVGFDLDDIDAAFEELDARYLAGEAAPYADTWSVVVSAHAAFNRHELPPTTPHWVNVDHRRGRAFAPGELTANIHAGWSITPDISFYFESVYRLTNLGAVVGSATRGTSDEGFDAEWRQADLLTVEGDRISRCEIFEESDVDKAIARFDELSRPAQLLENAASCAYERFWAYFVARDWTALTEVLPDNFSLDDRRRIVNAGVRHGRDAEIANLRAIAEMGITTVTPTVIATRGERLALNRVDLSDRDGPGDLYTEVLAVMEMADERLVAVVLFDLDDIDAAFAELDARYLAGEAAIHSHTWLVIAGSFAAVNRHELPELTPDWVNIDHRPAVAFAPGDMTAYIHATLDDTPEFRVYLEAVHRLSDLGAVVTWASNGTSRAGFQAEWREISIATVVGDLINRSEMFGETDLDAALARFDELTRQAPRLENAASRVYERFWNCFEVRDWDDLKELLAHDVSTDDRRRVVNAGVRHGRDALIADMRSLAEIEANVTSTVIANRGQRLALTRFCSLNHNLQHGEFGVEMLNIIETDADDRIVAVVSFDPDDLEAAIAELDARYLAGEAAAHAHTWSVITGGYAALNRHELPPTTPDPVSIDHRRGSAFAPGELIAYVRAGWDLGHDIQTYVEVVHRLNDFGAVVTHAAHGSSREGFDAEWRGVDILAVEGDMVSRSEVFDETDIDTAIAKFEQLSRPVPRLENAATRTYERIRTHFLARDWDALAETLADNHCGDDRRRVVNSGIRHGREAEIASMQATADVGVANLTSDTIATRGDRLALCRTRGATSSPEAFRRRVAPHRRDRCRRTGRRARRVRPRRPRGRHRRARCPLSRR